MEHTKGKWKVYGADKNHPSEIGVSACDGQVDIYKAPLTRDTRANAHLIASAPEMLEALKYVRRFVKKDDVDVEYVDEIINRAEGNQ